MDKVEPPTHRPPPFLEVTCKSSSMRRRFTIGTEAGFAVSLINKKLGMGDPLALHIEVVEQGEEPIHFGPNSILVDYGNDWILQTVNQVEFSGGGGGREGFVRPKAIQVPDGIMDSDSLCAKRVPKPTINFMYIGKIVLAFILIFVLGAILTLVLGNISELIKLLE